MATDEDLSDEYVAEILKEDAIASSIASSIKYSASGFQASMSRRPTQGPPKTNTRFLRNILRETDSHNAALLEKEQREARARFKGCVNADRRSECPKGSWSHEDGQYSQGQRFDGRPNTNEDESRKRRRSQRKEHASNRLYDLETDWHGERRSRLQEEDSDVRGPKRQRQRVHRHRDRSRSPINSFERGNSLARRRHRRQRDDYESTSPSPLRGLGSSSASRRERLTTARSSSTSMESQDRNINSSQKSDAQNSKARIGRCSTDSESDPLDAIVGPPLPKRSRGRGAFNSTFSTAMDSHFNSTYDPSEDIDPSLASEDDWDQALEALRDRQKWKQQGAERLRATGFTEAEVRRWEKGGEKDDHDVRWAKQGEGREWDRGKVVDEKGFVELKPEWGRLKGT